MADDNSSGAGSRAIENLIEQIELLEEGSEEYMLLAERLRDLGVLGYKKGGSVKKKKKRATKVKKVGAQPRTVNTRKRTKNVMRGTGAAIRGTKFAGVF
tara:strand:+ start:267 stop:563 length:297 start_codon:yes stop_codon:yes gene_type:complete